MTLQILRLILGIGLLPIFSAFYIESATKLTNYTQIRRYTYGNKFFWFSLATFSIVLYLEVKQINDNSPSKDDTNFEFFPSKLYESEITGIDSTSIKELMLKFDHAEYAWKRNDFDETIKTLQEIESGYDLRGRFHTFNSFVISNNLGCAYYKKQRNRNFLSSNYFNKSLYLLKEGTSARHKVEENLRTLDNLVNKVD